MAISLASARLVSALLYDISTDDPVSLATSVLVLAAVALCATLVPARVAARTTAAELLRSA